MRFAAGLCLMAIAGWGLAGAALADTKNLARSGSWAAFGGTTTKGLGVCGISGSPGDRYFSLKQFSGYDTFIVQLQVPSITDGDKVGMSLQFDANKLWTATATGLHFEDGDAGLEFTINRSEANRFAYEFESSSQLRIRFDSGLPQWVMGLQGTMAVSTAFKGCIRNLQ